ncbi:two-component sensor histidine kinase [Frankia sp. CcI156]|uniref:histidine kinase n=2 Tax=Frankia casuarinae (strain DSM 45818 / CECT 9043 / HFP020203 / CcI3) TaxID=106370 RepID=Q2JAF6_FRACC|nr:MULTISPECIES: HAMP domain-containing sensor histidine kinase [Frankia]ABD11736.1 periplasmic sensor signal transduction histidine kinase [Frankia casuarinae]ONH26874.1 two-component sensor histidine kinase [Frankia sp. CcI156]ORT47917.1 two-component sensor histidine kinase [Frankia sp. KB5]TFE32850.1 HAMP domain-containing histidine kinase [Frankia sp. B2]
MARRTVANWASRVVTWRLRWRDRLSLRAQLVTITALLASAVAAGLVIVVQISLAGAARSTTDRVLNDHVKALVASISAASPDGALHVPRSQLNPGVAVYDTSGSRVAGTIPPSMQEEYKELSTTDRQRIVEGGEPFAIMALPFTTSSKLQGVVILAEPLAPYERNEQAAMVVSIIAGALLVLMAAGSAAWISRRVLSPVEQMARTAAEWSEHDLERRFALGAPTNEIRALGSTLDGLLDKVASVIRAEQRLTSELAHELRTPLTTIHGAADLLALRTDLDDQAREDVALIKNSSASMSNTISALLDLARRHRQALHSDRTQLDDLAVKLKGLPLPRGHVNVDLSPALSINVPEVLAIRALAPILNNALQVSDRAWVSARADGRNVTLLVADSGPGVPDQWVETLFEPGWSGNGGSGLGLSLAKRVARSGGGDVSLVEQYNQYGGATFAVMFPGGRAARTQH